jgi:hypothetical protein
MIVQITTTKAQTTTTKFPTRSKVVINNISGMLGIKMVHKSLVEDC